MPEFCTKGPVTPVSPPDLIFCSCLWKEGIPLTAEACEVLYAGLEFSMNFR